MIGLSFEIFSEEMEEGEFKLTATLLILENSVMVFFDEKGSMKLGTLAIAIPKFGSQTFMSSVLLGDKNVVITKILAGRFSTAFNRIALVSTHLVGVTEREVGLLLSNLAKKIIEKAS